MWLQYLGTEEGEDAEEPTISLHINRKNTNFVKALDSMRQCFSLSCPQAPTFLFHAGCMLLDFETRI